MITAQFSKNKPTEEGYYLYMKHYDNKPILHHVYLEKDQLGVKINGNFFALWLLNANGSWSEKIHIILPS